MEQISFCSVLKDISKESKKATETTKYETIQPNRNKFMRNQNVKQSVTETYQFKTSIMFSYNIILWKYICIHHTAFDEATSRETTLQNCFKSK